MHSDEHTAGNAGVESDPEAFSWLIHHMHPPHRKHYGDAELGEALGVTRTFVHAIRTGAKPIPKDLRRDITDLFGVPAEYFTDASVRAEVQDEVHRVKEALRGDVHDPREDVAARFLALRALSLRREAERHGAADAFVRAMNEYEATPRDRRRRRKRDDGVS